MRVMIDILHPAHVHFFKHFYAEMRERGHELLVTGRDKDRAPELLKRLGIPCHTISTAAVGGVRQAGEFVTRGFKFLRLAREFRPDVLTGIMGPTIAVAGKLLKVPVFVFYDTEFARRTNRFVYPLATKVVTPDCYTGPVGPHQVTYPGYHELAYLHPDRFTADPEIVRRAGVDPARPLAVVRFVGWWATHDKGERGLSREQKIRAVERLAELGQVVVTSEADVPPPLERYVYRGPVESIHHLLGVASLFYGESATMASESAVQGTPAVYIATSSRGYTDDQARYGLVHRFDDRQYDASISKAVELFARAADTKEQAAMARKEMLVDKIDVTSFMVELFQGQPAVPTEPAAV